MGNAGVRGVHVSPIGRDVQQPHYDLVPLGSFRIQGRICFCLVGLIDK